MARTRDAPSHNRFSTFRCEEGVVTDVNRNSHTVTVETRHTAKRVDDITPLVPYHHYENGEGISHLPEVGAICMLGWPSDSTPPFIMGYKPAASVRTSEDQENPEGTDLEGEPVDEAVSFRSKRLDMNPGDIALTTRDENFVILRRGGVIQIGATPISQRVYIPVLNFIRDFAENYRMDTFGGDVSWLVERDESDAGGDAPATYILHLNTHAQDEKATVRVRHMALSEPGEDERAAWEVYVAPDNIDRDTGEVSGEVYSLFVMTDGEKTEFIGANRTTTVEGDDSLDVQGKRTVTTQGNHEITAQGAIKHVANGEHVVGGRQVKIGSQSAGQPGVKGTDLVTILSALTVADSTGNVSTPSPAWITSLQRFLSNKVFLE